MHSFNKYPIFSDPLPYFIPFQHNLPNDTKYFAESSRPGEFDKFFFRRMFDLFNTQPSIRTHHEALNENSLSFHLHRKSL